MYRPAFKSLFAFCCPFFLVVTCFLSGDRVAFGKQTAEPAKRDLEQIRKLIECAERFQKIDRNDFSHLGHKYLESLIASERFDDAFEKIKSDSSAIADYGEDFAVERMLAAYLNGLEEQIDDLVEFHSKRLGESKAWFIERMEKLKLAAKALCEIENQSEAAIPAVLNQIENRVAYHAMRSEEFWIRTTLVTGGEDIAKQLVERLVQQGTDPSKLESRKKELSLYMQPRAMTLSYRKELHETQRRVAYAELMDRAKMPLADWLLSALNVMRYDVVTDLQQRKLIAEILELLESGGLPDYKREQIRWQLIEYLGTREEFELINDILQDHAPGASNIFEFGRFCEKVNLSQRKFINQLVPFLPQSTKLHAYSKKLMDFLLRTGHISKARENVEFLSPPIAERYRRIISFYETLHKTKFEGLAEIAELYASFREEFEYDSSLFTFLLNDLGMDHLAQIAINTNPQTALAVARTIPVDKYRRYNDSNSVGLCAAALLRRGRVDLALQLASFAKPIEIEKARITKLNDTPIPIEDHAWCQLESVAPNDRVVISQLIRAAIKTQDKGRALALAKRAFRYHRSLCGTESLFAKTDWVDEILKLSEIVTKDENGNDISGRFQKRFAKTIGLLMDFENAEDAIEYSRKRVKRGEYGAEFLFELAVKWKDQMKQ